MGAVGGGGGGELMFSAFKSEDDGFCVDDVVAAAVFCCFRSCFFASRISFSFLNMDIISEICSAFSLMFSPARSSMTCQKRRQKDRQQVIITRTVIKSLDEPDCVRSWSPTWRFKESCKMLTPIFNNQQMLHHWQFSPISNCCGEIWIRDSFTLGFRSWSSCGVSSVTLTRRIGCRLFSQLSDIRYHPLYPKYRFKKRAAMSYQIRFNEIFVCRTVWALLLSIYFVQIITLPGNLRILSILICVITQWRHSVNVM